MNNIVKPRKLRRARNSLTDARPHVDVATYDMIASAVDCRDYPLAARTAIAALRYGRYRHVSADEAILDVLDAILEVLLIDAPPPQHKRPILLIAVAVAVAAGLAAVVMAI